MGDFLLVDPQGWEYDLHSVYSAYIGYFQQHNVPWYDRSWGHLFSSFEGFLAFSWPVITVTDAYTGRPHIVTRLTSIGAFLKMVKTRFGETLPHAPNLIRVTPFESASRHLRTISDYASYKKLHGTLPAIVFTALKTRIRVGEPKAIKELWEKRDKTFLAIDFEWNERNEKSCLEFGYAAVRCAHLNALDRWPPVPNRNYRKGHFIVADYVDKVVNKFCPTHPWQYAFGDSQVIPKSKLPEIVQATISSLASPDSELQANDLVLIGHGISGDLQRLDEMKIKLPHNALILDTAVYERTLFASGQRGMMIDPKTNKPRISGSVVSLENLLRSFNTPISPIKADAAENNHANPDRAPIQLPNCVLHNAGNDALMSLFALQMLLDPVGTQVPIPRKLGNHRATLAFVPSSPVTPPAPLTPEARVFFRNGLQLVVDGPAGLASPGMAKSRPTSAYDLSDEFEQMQLGLGAIARTNPGGPVMANGNGKSFLPGRRHS